MIQFFSLKFFSFSAEIKIFGSIESCLINYCARFVRKSELLLIPYSRYLPIRYSSTTGQITTCSFLRCIIIIINWSPSCLVRVEYIIKHFFNPYHTFCNLVKFPAISSFFLAPQFIPVDFQGLISLSLIPSGAINPPLTQIPNLACTSSTFLCLFRSRHCQIEITFALFRKGMKEENVRMCI